MNEQVLKQEFEVACSDSSKRQIFLDHIDFGPLRHVKRLVYKKQQKGSTIMAINVNSLLSIFGGRFKIFVYPISFDKRMHENVYDFLCTLYYHEGFHAIQKIDRHKEMIESKDPSLVNYPNIAIYKEAIVELKAIENELKHLTEKNSLTFKSELTDRYIKTKEVVAEMSKSID